MPVVRVKGVANPMQFPDDMDIEDIKSFLQRKFAQQAVTGNKPADLAPLQGQARATEQSLAQKAGQGISNALVDSGIISDRFGAQRIGENVTNISEFLPVIGDATAGDEFGRALKQGDGVGVALGALGAIPLVGDAAKKAGNFINSKGDNVSDITDIDFDNPITHATPDEEFNGVINSRKHNQPFDGLFASYGETSNYGGGNKEITYYPRKGAVARHGDVDFDYDKTIDFLKKKYPDADEDKLNDLYEITAEESSVWDRAVNPLEDYGYDDLGEASWEAQNLRGQIAVDQGFDAVEMDDEFGTSIMIPLGSKAVKSTD
jgi:hypothetical protein